VFREPWGGELLVARNHQPNNLLRVLPLRNRNSASQDGKSKSSGWREPQFGSQDIRTIPTYPAAATASEENRDQIVRTLHPNEIDPLYLFACEVEWARRGNTTAGWDIISAARSSHENTRAHARALLEHSQQKSALFPDDSTENSTENDYEQSSTVEAGMRTPYGLEIIESCMGCPASREGFFCRFSPDVLRSVDAASHHTIMPSGAVLFVEGQTPRGVFVLCSGKVKLSTTSKEGKVLILKQAEAGEVLGLSAAISGTSYVMTAEAASACQLDFISRQDLMALLERESEVGVHAAQWLSREFQGAYRDIHDLVLARSSSGKLARLLLSCAPQGISNSGEFHLRSIMTHEEMAQRIGSSRETVTRLLSHLKKKRLIRLDGATLVVRDRTGLEALAV
jgi:CRP/FNR family cyclic AMP-dependent transcriptional regulator